MALYLFATDFACLPPASSAGQATYGPAAKQAEKQQEQYFLRRCFAALTSPDTPFPELTRAPSGKPYFKDLPELHFNLSHSGSLLCLAFHHQEVGIDCEVIRPRRRLDSLAEHILSEHELPRFWQLRLRGCAEADRGALSLVLERWTVRECLLKASGAGIYLRHTLHFKAPDRVVSVYNSAGLLQTFSTQGTSLPSGFISVFPYEEGCAGHIRVFDGTDFNIQQLQAVSCCQAIPPAGGPVPLL